VETVDNKSGDALRNRALSHAAGLAARLKRDQNELTGEGAELAKRVIEAAGHVETQLAARKPDDQDRHE
jgi:hypothetical protein